MSDTELSKMKVADLKRELKMRGLPITGNKNELQDRLQAAILSDTPLDDSSAIAGDELLDDAVLSDEEDDGKALHNDDDLLKSPLPPTPEGSGKQITDDDILQSPTTTTKKISLKRVSTGSLKTEETEKSKENTEPTEPKVIKMSEKHPIRVDDLIEKDKGATNKTAENSVNKKITELTLEERLAIRAKKFGIATNTEAPKTPQIKKKSEPIDTSSLPSVTDEKQIELLKKRAERFGCVTSTKIAKIDAQEKLLKRKERFNGNNVSTNSTQDTPAKGDDWEEKARQRLEKFSKPTVSTTVESSSKAEVKN